MLLGKSVQLVIGRGSLRPGKKRRLVQLRASRLPGPECRGRIRLLTSPTEVPRLLKE